MAVSTTAHGYRQHRGVDGLKPLSLEQWPPDRNQNKECRTVKRGDYGEKLRRRALVRALRSCKLQESADPMQILNLTVNHRKLIEDGLKLWFGQCCIEQVFQAVPFFLGEAELYAICAASKSEQP